MEKNYTYEIETRNIHTHIYHLVLLEKSSSRCFLMFINGDRINIISFACANNSTYVHVEMKIVLTMKKASLVVVLTQDESEEDEEEEEERDETLINGLDRIVLCLSLLFLFFSLL